MEAKDKDVSSIVEADEIEALFVQTAHDVSYDDGKLTLHTVAPTTLFFSDRPDRVTGHELTYEVLILDGEMPVAGGPSALFIDTIGRPMSPVSAAGMHRRDRRRDRRDDRHDRRRR